MSKEAISKVITLLQKFPNDKVRHYASFKTTQIERFCTIGGIPVPANLSDYEPKAPVKLVKIDADKLKRMVFGDNDGKVDYQKDLYNNEIINEQYRSLRNIYSDKHSSKYQINDKLLKPKGNPNYYQRLINDVNNGGQKKESFFKAFKTVVTGKY